MQLSPANFVKIALESSKTRQRWKVFCTINYYRNGHLAFVLLILKKSKTFSIHEMMPSSLWLH